MSEMLFWDTVLTAMAFVNSQLYASINRYYAVQINTNRSAERQQTADDRQTQWQPQTRCLTTRVVYSLQLASQRMDSKRNCGNAVPWSRMVKPRIYLLNYSDGRLISCWSRFAVHRSNSHHSVEKEGHFGSSFWLVFSTDENSVAHSSLIGPNFLPLD